MTKKLDKKALGQRLKQIRKSKGLKIKQVVADFRHHISTIAYYKWESGQNEPNSENLTELARVLEVDPLSLIIEDYQTPDKAEFNFRSVPLVAWEKASKAAQGVHKLKKSDIQNGIVCTFNPSSQAYAVQVPQNDESMVRAVNSERSYPPGTIMFIDHKEVKDGAFVFTRQVGSRKPELRRYVEDNNKKYLYALNSDIPIDLAEEKHNFLGVLIGDAYRYPN